MPRVDLKDRLGGGIQPPCPRKQPFERPVGPGIGRDQADGAVGQPIRGAHLRHRIAEDCLREGEKILDLFFHARRRFRGRGVSAGDEREIRRTLRHRLERLAVERDARHHPKTVHRIGQQQHLDAAGAEAFKMRRSGETADVVAGEVIDCGLIGFERRRHSP